MSENEITSLIVSKNNQCYKCEKHDDDNLISPCNNPKCSSIIHRKCLFEQYKSGILKC